MYVYHYTQRTQWPKIKVQGLRTSPLIKYDYRYKLRGVFALEAPQPKQWEHNTIFPKAFDHLISHTGELLLKIQLEPLIDNCFVLDWGHLAVINYFWESNLPQHFTQYDNYQTEVHNTYSQNMISFTEYQNNQPLFLLPEIFIKQAIPSELLSVCETQPMLEIGIEHRLNLGDITFLNTYITDFETVVPEFNIKNLVDTVMDAQEKQ